MNRPDRVIIISLDAMGSRDLPFMETLPNFKKIMEHSSLCKNVSSVYPSLTYPAHTSIITGRKPVHHGVINNTLVQPRLENPDWMWQRKYVSGTTLYDEARKAGYQVAALLWPVTAKAKIKYNIPEVLANRPWQNQVVVSALNGSMMYEMELLKMFGHLRDGVRQPALDNFVHASACHTIRKYDPDMMLIHFTDLDTNRHIYGLDHEKTFAAMERHDMRLGQLWEALVETRDMAKTTVILLGDHCQFDTNRVVYFNYLLKEKGYLTVKNNKIDSYKVIAKNCDGSCYIYLHPKYEKNQELKAEIIELFHQLAEDETYGIDRIFTGKEAGMLGADDKCLLMIEAKEPVYYLDDFDALTKPVKEVKHSKMKATHGYLPDKPDYKTFFLATGYGIREKVEIESMELYDEGPTLARLMGLDLGKVDGRVVEEILY